MLVLPLGLGKFGHDLNADLLKKDHLLLITSSMKLLPQENLEALLGSISNHLATLVYACVSDQQIPGYS